MDRCDRRLISIQFKKRNSKRYFCQYPLAKSVYERTFEITDAETQGFFSAQSRKKSLRTFSGQPFKCHQPLGFRLTMIKTTGGKITLRVRAGSNIFMRTEPFTMECNVLNVGDIVPITEGKLPRSYYYMAKPAAAMSKNFAPSNRIRSDHGTVVKKELEGSTYTVWIEFEE